MFISLFFILFVITLIVVIFLIRKRYGLLFFLFFLSPTILVTNSFCSDRSTYSTQKVAVANLMISCIDVIAELTGHHHGMGFSDTNGWYFDTLFLIEIYSLFFIFFMYYFLRKYTWKSVMANFKYYFEAFYSKIYALGPLVGISIITILFLNTENHISQWAFSDTHFINLLTYLSIYFTLLTFLIPKFFYLRKEEKFLVLFLVLFFPVISISGEYKSVPICYAEVSNYENHLSIYPLIYAIPKTILSFLQNFDSQKYSPSIVLKLYSIMHIAFVIILFPSLLNINNETKKQL